MNELQFMKFFLMGFLNKTEEEINNMKVEKGIKITKKFLKSTIIIDKIEFFKEE